MNTLFFTIFMIFVVVMLALDLTVFHKKDHVVGVREAAVWTGIWVALAMGFAVLVLLFGDFAVQVSGLLTVFLFGQEALCPERCKDMCLLSKRGDFMMNLQDIGIGILPCD